MNLDPRGRAKLACVVRYGAVALIALLATVSLGARRRFLLQPVGGRPAHELRPGHGDLVVMGGACQHEWEHTVPKQSTAVGPMMSITLRRRGAAAGVADQPVQLHVRHELAEEQRRDYPEPPQHV